MELQGRHCSNSAAGTALQGWSCRNSAALTMRTREQRRFGFIADRSEIVELTQGERGGGRGHLAYCYVRPGSHWVRQRHAAAS